VRVLVCLLRTSTVEEGKRASQRPARQGAGAGACRCSRIDGYVREDRAKTATTRPPYVPGVGQRRHPLRRPPARRPSRFARPAASPYVESTYSLITTKGGWLRVFRECSGTGKWPADERPGGKGRSSAFSVLVESTRT